MSDRSRQPEKVPLNPKRTVRSSQSILQNSSREPFLTSIVELKLMSSCNCNFVSSHPRKLGSDLHIFRENQQEKEEKET